MALRIKVQICFYDYFKIPNRPECIVNASFGLCLRIYKAFTQSIKEIGFKPHGTNDSNYMASRKTYDYLLDVFHRPICVHSSPG